MEYTSLIGGGEPCNMSVINASWLIFSLHQKIPAWAISITKISDYKIIPLFFWCFFFWLYLQTKELAQTLPRLPLAFYFFRVQSAKRAWLVFPCLKVTLGLASGLCPPPPSPVLVSSWERCQTRPWLTLDALTRRLKTWLMLTGRHVTSWR